MEFKHALIVLYHFKDAICVKCSGSSRNKCLHKHRSLRKDLPFALNLRNPIRKNFQNCYTTLILISNNTSSYRYEGIYKNGQYCIIYIIKCIALGRFDAEIINKKYR